MPSVGHQQLRHEDSVEANKPQEESNEDQEDADDEVHFMRLILRLVYELFHRWFLRETDTLVGPER